MLRNNTDKQRMPQVERIEKTLVSQSPTPLGTGSLVFLDQNLRERSMVASPTGRSQRPILASLWLDLVTGEQPVPWDNSCGQEERTPSSPFEV